MKKLYNITVFCNGAHGAAYRSESRNAKKHLIENYGGMMGGTCIVTDMHDNILSCCKYSPENGGMYYYCTL